MYGIIWAEIGDLQRSHILRAFAKVQSLVLGHCLVMATVRIMPKGWEIVLVLAIALVIGLVVLIKKIRLRRGSDAEKAGQTPRCFDHNDFRYKD